MFEMIRGYHFTGERLRNGGPVPPVGEWLEVDGDIDPCLWGLHMSPHPYDALMYAPGFNLHRVEIDGELQAHDDRLRSAAARAAYAAADAAEIKKQRRKFRAMVEAAFDGKE
jgi:hypothetical protein